MDALINLDGKGGILSQYIYMYIQSSHCILYLTALFINYTSIRLKTNK